MTYTTTAISTPELRAYNADNPCFVVGNVLANPIVTPTVIWVDGVAGVVTDPSDSSATYPTSRLYDGFGHLVSRAATSGDTAYTLVMSCNWAYRAVDFSTFDFDTILLVGHNFASYGFALTVTVQISSAASFLGAAQVYTVTIPATTAGVLGYPNTRRVAISLGPNGNDFLRYSWASGSTAFYVRIIISAASPMTPPPSIGEVILGRRYQLSYDPRTPWDVAAFDGDMVKHKSDSGVITNYVRSKGGKVFRADWRYGLGNSQWGINDYTTWQSIMKHSNYGQDKVFFIPKPATVPDQAYWVTFPSNLPQAKQGPYETTTSLLMDETSPFVATEVG